MEMKRKMVTVLACIMVCLMSACTSNNKEESTTVDTSADTGVEKSETARMEQPDHEKVLVAGLYNGLDSLNPWTSGRITQDMVKYTLYETLASCQSGATEIDYILMKDYERIDDNTYSVEIYDYITDAEGNNITASDVEFSFKEYAKNWAITMENFKVTGDYTFDLTLNTPAAGAFEYIVCKVPIASETAYNNSPDQLATTSCGTMPYTVAGGSDYINGTTIIARKTNSYWQKDESLIYPGSAANADVIEFRILAEATQLALAVEDGSVDIAMYIDASMLDEVAAAEHVELLAVPSTEDRGIMFCMTEESPFYDNLKLRQAVLYAIDNEAVAEACGYGYGSPSIVTTGNAKLTIGYDSGWETSPYAYDPAKAKELLAAAGYGKGKLHLRLLCNNNAKITTMWQIIQSNLIEIGIDAELNVCEGTTYGAYRDGTSGQYELAYAGPGNGGYVTADLWNTLFNRNSYNSGRTWAGLSDDKLQELYDNVAAVDGYNQENLNAFYEYITDEALYYRIYDLADYAAYNSETVGDYFVDWNRFIRLNTIEVK